MIDRHALAMQKAIIHDAEAKLKRPLRDYERRFVESRGGYVALEMIHDTVKASDADELESYLGSECPDPPAT